MVPTKNVAPTGDTEEPQETKKTDDLGRPVTETSLGDRKGQKFKEVLSTLEEKGKSSKQVVQDDTGEDTVSPMTLAVDTATKKTAKPSKDDAADLVAYTTDESDVDTDTTPVVKGPADDATITKTKAPQDETQEVLKSAPYITTASTTTPKEKPTVVKTTKAENLKDTEVTQAKTPIKVSTENLQIPSKKVGDKVVEADTEETEEVDTEQLLTTKPKDDTLVAQVNPAPQPLAHVPIINEIREMPEQVAKAREVLIRVAEQISAHLDKMAASMQVVTTPERTDTTIKLQYPPLFAGAEVVISEHKIAQHQFNVTFTGLSPEAQNLVLLTQNQEELRKALLEKGYTLQNVAVERMIPGLESTRAETGYSRLGGEARADTEGNPTEEER